MHVGMMLPVDRQMAIEHTYNKKFIDKFLLAEIEDNPTTMDRVAQGVALLESWMNQDYYGSKNARLEQIQGIDLEDLVKQVFVQVAYCQTPELFTSVTAQLASRLNFSDKPDAILTMAEITAVLCQTDVFDITKPSPQASLLIQSQLPISDRLMGYIQNAAFLPPMVCEPNPVESNYQNGYLTYNDSLLLGRGNHHEGDLCLDVINNQNRVPLKLSLEFLKSMEECPNKPITWQNVKDDALSKGTVLTDAQAKDLAMAQEAGWSAFKSQSAQMYILMLNQGNRFYLTNKVDKRGRLYSIGYHIHTQGSAFKKASIELADEEIVDGVP